MASSATFTDTLEGKTFTVTASIDNPIRYRFSIYNDFNLSLTGNIVSISGTSEAKYNVSVKVGDWYLDQSGNCYLSEPTYNTVSGGYKYWGWNHSTPTNFIFAPFYNYNPRTSESTGSIIDLGVVCEKYSNSVDLPVIVKIYNGSSLKATLTSTVASYVKPSIEGGRAERTNSQGQKQDDGECAVITAILKYDVQNSESDNPGYYSISYKKKTEFIYTDLLLAEQITEKVTNINYQTGEIFDTETSYDIRIHIYDGYSNLNDAYKIISLDSAFFTMDFLEGGKGIAFGCPSTKEGFECDMETWFDKQVHFGNNDVRKLTDYNLINIGHNVTNGVNNDTYDFWLTQGNGRAYFNQNNMFNGQTSQWAWIFNYVQGNIVFQFRVDLGASGMYKRSGSSSSTGLNDWVRIIDTKATGSVTDTMLASNSVTTAKIADSNVTNAKLASNAVTTAKIADGAITSGKIADGQVAKADLTTAVQNELATGLNSGTYVNADDAIKSVLSGYFDFPETPKLRRRGKVACIYLPIKRKTGTLTIENGTSVATLPDGFHPLLPTKFGAFNQKGEPSYCLRSGTSGNLTAVGNITPGTTVYLCGTFLVS